MIEIAVCGACGRMGRRIIRTAVEQEDLEVVAAIDVPKTPQAGKDAGEVAGVGKIGVKISEADRIKKVLEKTHPDVLVDFTQADAAVKNMEEAAKKGIAIVVGTTGFSVVQQKKMEKTIKKANIPALISPNMSVGVNVFFKLSEVAA